jgi:pimeloyl-ACP methyl ester carboxylesterase
VIHAHDRGRGPAVVLVNGWTASGLVWPRELLGPLEEDHRVLRVDNRGTGWSREAPVPFTIRDLAEDVRGVLDRAGVGHATVLGFSMGGMVAQELALRHPDLVDHLVIVGSRPPAPEAISGSRHRFARILAPPGPGEPLTDYFRRVWSDFTGPGFAAAHPQRLDELVAQIVERPTPRFAVLAQLRAAMGWPGAARLTRLTVPTTIVHGDLDPLSPVRNGMRLAQLIAHARYVELEGVGHLVPQEAPERLVELLVEHPSAVRAERA